MHSILKKGKSAYKRIRNGFEVALFPEKFYLYPQKNYSFHNLSYSQEGEDMILSRFFAGKSQGFYIDVGAHHPQRFSNTYYFYLQGWRGINLDAMPGSMATFNKIRPRDINLEIAISDTQQKLTYYAFNEPALNGFCKNLANEYENLEQYKIVSQHEIKTHTLNEILDEYLPQDQAIDFLSVDVEGLDYQVLKSNNWKKYRPRIVLAEALRTNSIAEASQSNVSLLMNEQNYQLCFKTFNTLIFKEL